MKDGVERSTDVPGNCREDAGSGGVVKGAQRKLHGSESVSNDLINFFDGGVCLWILYSGWLCLNAIAGVDFSELSGKLGAIVKSHSKRKRVSAEPFAVKEKRNFLSLFVVI